MDISNLSGIIPPVTTPFDDNGNFDKVSYAKVIKRHIDAGVDGLFILGSNGAVCALLDHEREEAIRIAMELAKDKVPVLAGVVDVSTRRTVQHIKIAEKYNVDGIVATAPFYFIVDDAIVENHFRCLRQVTNLPIFAYDIPALVNKKLDFEMLVRLGTDKVLQGVKDSSGDDINFKRLVLLNEKAGHPLRLFTGHEVIVDGMFFAGADGAVPGLANVVPELYVDIWDTYKNQDFENMKKLQNKAARLMEIAFCDKKTYGHASGCGGFVTAMYLLGILKSNNLCNPFPCLEGKDVEHIKSILIEEGLL